MIEPAAREHETIEVCDREAHGGALGKVLQHPARIAAVPVQPAALTPEQRWGAERPALYDVGHVRKGSRIEQAMHRLVLIMAAVRSALQTVESIDGIDRGGDIGHLGNLALRFTDREMKSRIRC